MRRVGPLFLLALLASAASAAPAGGPTKHEDWHKLVQAGATMRIKRAGFFGAGGAEVFAAVAALPNGEIAAVGNSWGPPFPDEPKAAVMGSDRLVELPLHPAGLERDSKGNALPPPAQHPNRTGFLVQYAPDLGRIVSVTRFGWGVATMDAAVVIPDGGVIVAGTASEHFGAVAGPANARHLPAPRDPARCFGPLVYEGMKSPGDVYIGKLNAGRSGFDWLWVLDGFRRPPARLFVAADGSVVFESNHEVLRVAAGGATCVSVTVLPTPARGENVFLGGVGPMDGSLLVAGGRRHEGEVEAHLGTRLYTVIEPVLDLFSPEGKLGSRLYNWPVAITANQRVSLDKPCSISVACFLSDGRLAFAGHAAGAHTLLHTNPADLTQLCRPGKFMLNPASNPRTSIQPDPMLQIVTANPGSWSNSVRIPWVAMDGILPAEVNARGIAGMRDGRVALWGESGRWLIQTETNTFRAYDHVKYTRQEFGRPSTPEVNAEGKPTVLAMGGEGPFLTVFEPGFAGLAWSSALPGCRVVGVSELSDGLAVVSACMPALIPRYPEAPAGMENRPPALNTPWRTFGGGYSDAHILILGGVK